MDMDDAVRKIIENYEPERIFVKAGGGTSEDEVKILVIKRTIKNRIERMWDVYRIVREKDFAAHIMVLTPEELDERLKLADQAIKDIITRGKEFRW